MIKQLFNSFREYRHKRFVGMDIETYGGVTQMWAHDVYPSYWHFKLKVGLIRTEQEIKRSKYESKP